MAYTGHSTLLLPRKFCTDVTAIDADGNMDAGAVNDLVVNDNNHPHWVAWIEFYSDVAGTTLVVPNAGTIVVSVSPTSISGYGSYDEAITNGTITFATPTQVNWSGKTKVVRWTVGTQITVGSATHFRLFAQGYHS